MSRVKPEMVLSAETRIDLARALSRYYRLLTDHIVAQLGSRPLRSVLEAGCGKGQLTIPLIKGLPRTARLIAIDSFTGPYVTWLDELRLKLESARLEKRVQIVRSDVRRLDVVDDGTVDAIVSNELLCDLPRKSQLERALKEFYRILRPGGTMVHAEWSSAPVDHSGEFTVRHWPAWNPDRLFVAMTKARFHEISVTYFDPTVHFGYEMAVEELRSWGWTESLIKEKTKLLRRYGIRLPCEHIIRCVK